MHFIVINVWHKCTITQTLLTKHLTTLRVYSHPTIRIQSTLVLAMHEHVCTYIQLDWHILTSVVVTFTSTNRKEPHRL